MENRAAYDRICQEYELPIFYQSFYLDAVCGQPSWAAAIIETSQAVAIWPYYTRRKYGMAHVSMPPLTPYQGPWYKILWPKNNYDKLEIEKSILTSLADQLPKALFTVVNCHPSFSNWQPLYWKGFRQQTRYTSRIQKGDEQEVFQHIHPKQRNNILQAQQTLSLSITHDIELMYSLIEASFQAQHIRTPYAKEFFLRYDKALLDKSCRTIYVAYDEKNNPVAGIYIVHDKLWSYNIATGRRQNAHRGAVAMLISKAIQDALAQGRGFDFEGSMIEGVEHFFRTFGGEQTPFFTLRSFKNRSIAALMHYLGKV